MLWTVKPKFSLSYQINKLLEVYLSCSYSYDLSDNYLLKFKEESGVFKKNYKEDIIDGTLFYNSELLERENIKMDPLMVSIGFNFGFN